MGGYGGNVEGSLFSSREAEPLGARRPYPRADHSERLCAVGWRPARPLWPSLPHCRHRCRGELIADHGDARERILAVAMRFAPFTGWYLAVFDAYSSDADNTTCRP